MFKYACCFQTKNIKVRPNLKDEKQGEKILLHRPLNVFNYYILLLLFYYRINSRENENN